MNDGKSQWDDVKAVRNLAARGVSFESARQVFDDLLAIDWLDQRKNYGEERYSMIGMSNGRLLYVAYTMRGAGVRIITARKAEPHERRKYHEASA